MSVDEVESRRVTLCGIGEAGEDVPWGSDEEEGFERREGVKFAQSMQAAAETACEEQVDGDDRYREDDADEAFGEDIEGTGGGEASAEEAKMGRVSMVLVGAAEFFGAPEAVEGGREPEADHHVGDGDACEEKNPEAGEQDERGVEADARAGEEASG